MAVAIYEELLLLFNSYGFIFVFLPIVFFVFHFLKYRHALGAKVFLILASLFFYSYWKLEYLPILLFSILTNYFLAQQILNLKFNRTISNINNNDNNTANTTLNAPSLKKAKILLIFGLVFNVCLLGFFKYTDFLLENFNLFSQLFSLDFNIPLPHILLPLGISFITFQKIAFLVDCYKKDSYEKIHFIDFCLFVTFFPQLIAGPIVHHKEMMPQFHAILSGATQKTLFLWEYLAKGLFIFSIGLFKKVFIADTFSVWANAGFSAAENGEVLNFFESWATSLSYTFQLYFDFSGYCDMAIGLGLMFGIVLPINFNSPYKSLNIQDFWRRWHMTLSRFLRDYIYIPLGGDGRGRVRALPTQLRNFLIVFIIGGVWHGAGYGFFIWGVLHGVAMAVHRVYEAILNSLTAKYRLQPLKPHKSITENTHFSFEDTQSTQSALEKVLKQVEPKVLQPIETKPNTPLLAKFILNRSFSLFYCFLCWILTFNFINFAWVFFRAENIQGAINIIKGMFSLDNMVLPTILQSKLNFLAQYGIKFDMWATIFGEIPSYELFSWMAFAFILCLGCKNSITLLSRFKPNAKTLLFISLLAITALYNLVNISEFLYFNF